MHRSYALTHSRWHHSRYPISHTLTPPTVTLEGAIGLLTPAQVKNCIANLANDQVGMMAPAPWAFMRSTR